MKDYVLTLVFQAEIIQELFETIRNYKSEEGKLLCESFIRVPKRRYFQLCVKSRLTIY